MYCNWCVVAFCPEHTVVDYATMPLSFCWLWNNNFCLDAVLSLVRNIVYCTVSCSSILKEFQCFKDKVAVFLNILCNFILFIYFWKHAWQHSHNGISVCVESVKWGVSYKLFLLKLWLTSTFLCLSELQGLQFCTFCQICIQKAAVRHLAGYKAYQLYSFIYLFLTFLNFLL